MTSILKCLLLIVCLAAAPARAQDPIPLMAGTSLVEDILAGLAGGRVAVKTVIPAAACPGHYDVRTSDVAFLARAKLILLHDWQERMPALVSILDAVPSAREKVRVVRVKGNWMTPGSQAEATEAIARVLEETDSANAGIYRNNAKARIERTRSVGFAARERIREVGLEGAPVICDVMQRPFVEFLGLRVVADYGRFEETGAEALARTVTAAKAAGARLVLDNLQSTGAAGKALADDIGAGHATLTNFPGGLPGTDTWEAAVARNAELVVEASRR